MNTILTDDERREIHRKAAFAPSAVDALIAETEAAVLAKLREQEPVAIVKENPHCPEGESDELSTYLPVGMKLYAAPQPSAVQPSLLLADLDEVIRLTVNVSRSSEPTTTDYYEALNRRNALVRGLRAALASTERQQAEQAADRQPEVPAQWQEAMKVAREALDGMLQVHGVTQNDAIRNDTIPTSWVELSDEARAALAQLDSLSTASTERQPLTEWEIRGKLARLKCWHRLTEQEAADLVEFASALGIGGKEQG